LLAFKEEALTVTQSINGSAYNGILNSNMAGEQMEASKLLIMQRSSTAMLAQANIRTDSNSRISCKLITIQARLW
jgi:flagellin-like hook-associated protein FlgL